MSIADEIKKLKELLDSGVLSHDEYESAKQGLLNKFLAPNGFAFSQESFIGKWRLMLKHKNDDDIIEIDLFPDGNVKLRMTSPEFKEFSKSRFEFAVIALSGVTNGSGKWWQDQSQLAISLQLGNALMRTFLKNSGIGSSKLRIDLVAVSPHEIKGLNSETKDEVRLLRLGVQR